MTIGVDGYIKASWEHDLACVKKYGLKEEKITELNPAAVINVSEVGNQLVYFIQPRHTSKCYNSIIEINPTEIINVTKDTPTKWEKEYKESFK